MGLAYVERREAGKDGIKAEGTEIRAPFEARGKRSARRHLVTPSPCATEWTLFRLPRLPRDRLGSPGNNSRSLVRPRRRNLATRTASLLVLLLAIPLGRAGNGLVRAFLSRATPRWACTSGNGRASAPFSKSMAAVTNSSNVTIVDTGFPGNPKKNVSRQRPKTAGLPGRIATASKIKFGAKILQHRLDQIVLPHRDAAGHHQHVFPESALDLGAQKIRAIGGISEQHRFAAGDLGLRGERDAVAVANLEGTWFLVDQHDLVARGEDGDTGFRGAKQFRLAHLRGQATSAYPRRVPGDRIASPDFASLPRGTMFWPARVSRSKRTFSPSRWVCSIMTTASAPAGTAAPVMICTQVHRLRGESDGVTRFDFTDAAKVSALRGVPLLGPRSHREWNG